MPAAIRSFPSPTKKRKLHDSGFARSVQQLEDQLTLAVAKNSSLNPLADLLDLTLTASDPQHTSKAIYALYRVFVVIVTNGNLLGRGLDEATKVVKSWIWERLNEYVDFLGSLLKDEEKFLRISSLQILFSLQKHLSTASTGSPKTHAQPQFHISHFRKISSFLLLCPPSKRPPPIQPQFQSSGNYQTDGGKIDADVLTAFLDTWLSVHDDIRWFFLREAASLLSIPPTTPHPHLPTNILSILERLNTFPTDPAELNSWWVAEMGSKPPSNSKTSSAELDDVEDDDDNSSQPEGEDDHWRKFFDDDTTKDPSLNKAKPPAVRLHKLTIHQSLHSLPSHRAVFTRAWLTLLPRLSLDSAQGESLTTSRSIPTDPTTKSTSKALAIRALNVMHRGVMPHLTRPVLVMDWIGASVDLGGTVGLLALNALFVLMKEYNLDYPSFYTRLYAFLDRDVLHLKHRARFFRMTELFLSSTHLPSTLLASFIKRLAGLSLSAPPAAIIMIIPFTYNILKRHPALMVMIHRSANPSDPSNDPYLPTEPSPLLTRALSTSLWELNTHKDHYHSGVSTLAKIFSEAFTKPGYSMEDFLDHTYGTLFESEANRKIKKEPALAVEMGKIGDLFPVGVDKDADEVTLSRDVISELWAFG